jgi:hypothetical protein
MFTARYALSPYIKQIISYVRLSEGADFKLGNVLDLLIVNNEFRPCISFPNLLNKFRT